MAKHKFQLEVPGGADRVLLHTCCAPCSSAIIECLMQHGVRPTIYYCNPNIYPREEYLIRKDECTRYALSLGLEIVDADYNHEAWLEAMRGLEQEPELWIPDPLEFERIWHDQPGAIAIMQPQHFELFESRGLPMREIARDALRVVVMRP